METFKLSYQGKHMSNDNKNHLSVEANVMNISAKFQLHPHYGSWEDDFLIFFANLSFRYQIQRFGQNSYVW